MKVARGRNGNTRNVTYTEPFGLRDGGKIVVWDELHPERVYVANYSKIESIPLDVIFCSAEEVNYEQEAVNLVDGDFDSIWHTTYGVTVAQYPHWVDFDCGQEKNIKGFTFLPRQDDSTNGDIKDWRLEVSNDNENWTEIAHGTFDKDKDIKRVDFEPVNARYVRFVALSSQNGADYASGSEFNILVAD